MVDAFSTVGRWLEAMVTVRAFAVAAMAVLAAILWRHRTRDEAALHHVIGRGVVAVLGVVGVGLALRQFAFLLQSEPGKAVERLSDLERSGMMVVFGFVTGTLGVVAIVNSYGVRQRAPAPSSDGPNGPPPEEAGSTTGMGPLPSGK